METTPSLSENASRIREDSFFSSTPLLGFPRNFRQTSWKFACGIRNPWSGRRIPTRFARVGNNSRSAWWKSWLPSSIPPCHDPSFLPWFVFKLDPSSSCLNRVPTKKILIVTVKVAKFGYLCKQEPAVPFWGGKGAAWNTISWLLEEEKKEERENSLFSPRFSRIRAAREIGARDLR